jgi:hypothetical protein
MQADIDGVIDHVNLIHAALMRGKIPDEKLPGLARSAFHVRQHAVSLRNAFLRAFPD